MKKQIYDSRQKRHQQHTQFHHRRWLPALLIGFVFSIGCGGDSSENQTAIPVTYFVSYTEGLNSSIQQCINYAKDGDTCLVLSADDPNDPCYLAETIDFQGKSITLRSNYGEDGKAQTILDGSAMESPGGPVVKFSKKEKEGAILDGFIIQNGSAGGEIPHGGGIQILSASPTITDCIIRNNQADEDGGGIWVFATGARPTFMNLDFQNNTAGGAGGGYAALHGTVILDNCCDFSGNVPDDVWP